MPSDANFPNALSFFLSYAMALLDLESSLGKSVFLHDFLNSLCVCVF